MNRGTLGKVSFHVPQHVQLIIKQHEIVRRPHGIQVTNLTAWCWINLTVFEDNVWEQRPEEVATTSWVR